MRRIVAVAASAGALVTGIGALAAPAQAATTDTALVVSGASLETASVEAAAKKWKPINAFANVSASGTYARGKQKVAIKGVLADGKKDGWSACVRFKATEGKKIQFLRLTLRYTNGVYADGKGSAKFTVSSANTGHLWVQECRRNKKTGKYAYANKKWRKLY